MAALTPALAARMGGADLNPTITPTAVTGDTIPAGCCLLVKNGAGAPITVTWKAPSGTAGNGMSFADLALTPQVPATTGLVKFGPFPATPWADPSTGLVTLVCSSVTTITVKAVQDTD